MQDDLKAGLKTALKNRDRTAVAALRSALAAIANAEAQPEREQAPAAEGGAHVAGAAIGVGAAEVERRALSAAEQRAIVAGEIRERVEAASQYERLGRDADADRVRREAEVLGGYVAD